MQLAMTSVPIAGSFVIGATIPAPYGALAIVSYATGVIGAVGFGLALTGFVLPPERPAPLRRRGGIRALIVHPLQFAGSDAIGLGVSGAF
jgi:hypothetical protein